MRIRLSLASICLALLFTQVQQDKTMTMESNSDNTTLIVTSTPDMQQQESLKAYVEGVMPLLMGLGGKVVKRSKIETTYLGKQTFTHLMIMDFPSKEALINMFDGEDYGKLIWLRDKAFSKINIQFADDL